MSREITLAQAITWMLALAGAIAALSWALLLFLADREQPATPFTAGGLALLLWAAIHLAERQPQPR